MPRWTLTNPDTSEVLTFDRNPMEMEYPSFERAYSTVATVNPNSRPLVFQGLNRPARKMSFTGTIYDRNSYEQLIRWFRWRLALELTDDFSDTWDIVITGLELKRKRNARNP